MDGGELGWVNAEDMVPAFREKMLKAKENVVVPPFRTQFGWHVMQVKGVRDQDVTVEVKRNRVKEIIRQRRYEEELQSWLRELRDQAFVEIKLKSN